MTHHILWTIPFLCNPYQTSTLQLFLPKPIPGQAQNPAQLEQGSAPVDSTQRHSWNKAFFIIMGFFSFFSSFPVVKAELKSSQAEVMMVVLLWASCCHTRTILTVQGQRQIGTSWNRCYRNHTVLRSKRFLLPTSQKITHLIHIYSLYTVYIYYI